MERRAVQLDSRPGLLSAGVTFFHGKDREGLCAAPGARGWKGLIPGGPDSW